MENKKYWNQIRNSKIDKISIIGGPGTGKSTLANNLGKKLKLPVYHIDSFHYAENWQMRDANERDTMIMDKIKEPQWIMDGTYKTTLESRIDKSDLIIFLNYSTFAKLKGIFMRYFKRRGKEKPDIPGCKEQMNWEFMKFTFFWNRNKKKFIQEILKKKESKKIMIFKNRKELNQWYRQEFGEKMEV